MIRVELQGGLGNQLFIWAMAHRLSEDYKTHIKLIVPRNKLTRDDRPCEIYELNRLCKHDISISESRYFSILTKFIDKFSSNTLVKKTNLMNTLRIITQKNTDDISIEISQPPRVLRGYFQSNELVESIKEEILDEISNHLRGLEYPENISDSKTNTSVHIRRGDTTAMSNEWGILTLEYYEDLINDGNDVIICTDEIDFSYKITKKFPNSVVISAKNSSAWQVLKIISNSHEFVMANSTLSWWGAWIAINTLNTKVYFPEPWRPNNQRISDSLKMDLAVLVPAVFESKP
jgi:hypothetical protein